MNRGSTRVAKTLILACCLFAASALQAQAAGSNAAVCSAFEISPVEGEAPQLAVACGSQGVSLGNVDSYELVQFPALDATVIVTTLDSAQRAFLLIKNGEDSVALEEITTAIAQDAGRGALSNIAGIRLDYGNAATGLITAAINSASANSNPSVAIDIAAMVERSRAVRMQAAPAGGK